MKLPINANIVEVPPTKAGGLGVLSGAQSGAHYPVRLEWLPRVGDLIDLWSYIDQTSGHDPVHHYEVVGVIHELCDLTGKADVPTARTGKHLVTLHVKPSRSKLFGAPAEV